MRYPEEDTGQYTVHKTTHKAVLALETLVVQLAKHTHTNKHTRCTLSWMAGGRQGEGREGRRKGARGGWEGTRRGREREEAMM